MPFKQIIESSQKTWLFFHEALKNPEKIQQELLQNCLQINKDTLFAKEHGFTGIRNVDEFKKAVPIRNYNEYLPWIRRCLANEERVLTEDSVSFYFTSSGSTGTPKQIPATKSFIRENYLPLAYISMFKLLKYFPQVGNHFNNIINFKWDPEEKPEIAQEDTRTVGLSQVDWSNKVGVGMHFEPGMFAPWSSPPAGLSQTDRIYYRLRLAAESRDIFSIVGINPRLLISLPYLLNEWKERLIRDVYDGTVAGKTKKEKNTVRAAELEKLAAYFGTLQPSHIWPEIQLLYMWTGGAAAIYRRFFQTYYGNHAALFSAPVAASEGSVAIPVDRNSFGGPLALPFTFLEFAAADEQIHSESNTCLFNELQPSHYYQVIITHGAGMYRYSLGDLIKVIHIQNGVPHVEYAGRNTVLEITNNCRLMEYHVVAAAEQASKMCELQLVNISCRRAPGILPQLEIAAEFKTPCGPADVVDFGYALDRALTVLHSIYGSERTKNIIAPLRVVLLSENSFNREWLSRVESGIRPAQVKDKVLITANADWERLTGSG
jgi:hypothetical protein